MPDKAAEKDDMLNDIREKMSSHKTYVEERLKEIKPRLDALKRDEIIIVDCPFCLQTALSIPGGEDS